MSSSDGKLVGRVAQIPVGGRNPARAGRLGADVRRRQIQLASGLAAHNVKLTPVTAADHDPIALLRIDPGPIDRVAVQRHPRDIGTRRHLHRPRPARSRSPPWSPHQHRRCRSPGPGPSDPAGPNAHRTSRTATRTRGRTPSACGGFFFGAYVTARQPDQVIESAAVAAADPHLRPHTRARGPCHRWGQRTGRRLAGHPGR